MILRDTQREMRKFPLEPYPYPTAFQWMSLQDKMNHLGQKIKWGEAGGAGTQLLMCSFLLNLFSKLTG